MVAELNLCAKIHCVVKPQARSDKYKSSQIHRWFLVGKLKIALNSSWKKDTLTAVTVWNTTIQKKCFHQGRCFMFHYVPDYMYKKEGEG